MMICDRDTGTAWMARHKDCSSCGIVPAECLSHLHWDPAEPSVVPFLTLANHIKASVQARDSLRGR